MAAAGLYADGPAALLTHHPAADARHVPAVALEAGDADADAVAALVARLVALAPAARLPSSRGR